MIKRLVALILVLLLCIESFAAVVSDNDGSAFITKAEFDSLKNNFQSQIDQYNTSIDNKIDGAIASYLAGIKLNKETVYNVEIADWGSVLATNYVLPERWQMPDLNLTFNYNYASTNPNGVWYETWWGTAGIVYNRDTSTIQQIRNLVSAGVESTTTTLPNQVVWLGQSKNYKDKITGVKSGVCASVYGRTGTVNEQHRYSYLGNATTNSSVMSIVTALQLESGYVVGKNVSDIWNSKMYWWDTSGNFTCEIKPTVDSDWVNKDLSTSVSLLYVDGKQYQNEHIITFDNYNWSQLSDPTWTNTLGENPYFTENDTLTNANIKKAGRWACFEYSENSMGARAPSSWEASSTTTTYGIYQPKNATFAAFYSGDYGTTRTNAMKSVGVLNKTYTSQNILQWNGNRQSKRDGKKTIGAINLYNGVLVAYAKADEIFKWEPKITGTYWDPATSTDKVVKKWRVKLSKKPFGIQDSVSAPTDVLKNIDQTEDYLVTSETTGTCKYNFELGEDTIIYCKWWPDDSNICNNYDWAGALDLTQCGTYSITES